MRPFGTGPALGAAASLVRTCLLGAGARGRGLGLWASPSWPRLRRAPGPGSGALQTSPRPVAAQASRVLPCADLPACRAGLPDRARPRVERRRRARAPGACEGAPTALGGRPPRAPGNGWQSRSPTPTPPASAPARDSPAPRRSPPSLPSSRPCDEGPRGPLLSPDDARALLRRPLRR